ncbi:hypothetical protein LCM23_14705 [Cytobacillus kochii]|uniref:hypothetical protein n=1 Tax=Cytobacillus kochii TaxID=859143 RepID=UPI001CD48E94|nr:hypothetical protein [Cytobacillus kochii]MCA1027346.1 hypothetical protein [Cytobacillus kochii]
MRVEIIPFKSFVAGYSSFTPDPVIFSLVDGGLAFFISTGAVLVSLCILEKMGVPINHATVRIVGLGGVLFALAWAIAKNPLIRSLVIGF